MHYIYDLLLEIRVEKRRKAFAFIKNSIGRLEQVCEGHTCPFLKSK